MSYAEREDEGRGNLRARGLRRFMLMSSMCLEFEKGCRRRKGRRPEGLEPGLADVTLTKPVQPPRRLFCIWIHHRKGEYSKQTEQSTSSENDPHFRKINSKSLIPITLIRLLIYLIFGRRIGKGIVRQIRILLGWLRRVDNYFNFSRGARFESHPANLQIKLYIQL